MTSKVRNIALPVILTALFVRTMAMAAESKPAPEEPEIYLGNSAAIVGGRVELQKYPDTFFGLGNDTSLDAAEGYTSRQVSLSVYAKKKIWKGKKFFAGISYSYDYYRLRDLDVEGQLAASANENYISGGEAF
jgi:hypothetical protein